MSEFDTLSDLLTKTAEWLEKDAQKINLLTQIVDTQKRTIEVQKAAIKELEEFAKYANQVIEALYDKLDDLYEEGERS